MRLLEHSNSMKKISMKKKMSIMGNFKKVIIILIIIFGTGFLVQTGYNFFANESIKSRMSYTRIDGKRIDYKTSGSGNYTVIFDGPIGVNANVFEKVINDLSKLNVKTFIYNRPGYGKSEWRENMTPKTQAELLEKVLKKAAVSGNYILVGEGYGSLVMDNFAKLNPDKIKGVVYVNPINQNKFSEYKTFKNKISLGYKKFQSIGANFGLTLLLDKLGLATNYNEFENFLSNEHEKSEYEWNINRAPFREAVYSESKNIYNGNSTAQTNGMYKNIPYYLITNTKNSEMLNLGSKDLTKEYVIEGDKDIAITNPKDISNGIFQVYDQANRLKAREENKK